jgi:hypothetical protein
MKQAQLSSTRSLDGRKRGISVSSSSSSTLPSLFPSESASLQKQWATCGTWRLGSPSSSSPTSYSTSTRRLPSKISGSSRESASCTDTCRVSSFASPEQIICSPPLSLARKTRQHTHALSFADAGWFWIDAPSSLPVELITFFVNSEEGTSHLSLLRFLRMFRLLRLLRLLKVSMRKQSMPPENPAHGMLTLAHARARAHTHRWISTLQHSRTNLRSTSCRFESLEW